MNAGCITVGVFALDQVLMPKAAGGKGWVQRLAEAAPVLQTGALPCTLDLIEADEDVVLAEPVVLSGASYPAGGRVVVEPVVGRPGLYLVRIAGRAVALASAAPWPEGAAHQGDPEAERPGALAAVAAGTQIDTPDGPRPAGLLMPGDAVTTLGNGSRPLRWVGRRRVTALELLAHPGLRPVAFAQGAAGNARGLMVSAQQRMLIDDWRAEVYFGEDRVLVAAQALVDDQAARVVLPPEGVDYVVLLCDRHEVLLAEGALSESFHPGDSGLAGLTPGERTALAEVCAEQDLARRRAAYPIVRNAEARALRI